MDNSKSDDNKSTDENPSANPPAATVVLADGEAAPNDVVPVNPPRQQSTRVPFTDLSQVDADLALARTLQEQERAYMMLRMNSQGGDYGSWDAGSYYHEDDEDFDDASGDEFDGSDVEADDATDEDIDDDGDDNEDDDDDDDDEDDGDDDDEEEDAFDVHAHEHEEAEEDGVGLGVELDPASFPNDEAYARALQDVEDREMAERLLALAGLNEREDVDMDEHGDNSQDTWDEVDPDELSYEELIALGEAVGTESRGLSADTIASLPSASYKKQKTQDASCDSCVICRLDYEDDDTLTVLSCKHSYHSECINNWLRINKVCPICSAEVSTSRNS